MPCDCSLGCPEEREGDGHDPALLGAYRHWWSTRVPSEDKSDRFGSMSPLPP